jgi:hypothetical protein
MTKKDKTNADTHGPVSGAGLADRQGCRLRAREGKRVTFPEHVAGAQSPPHTHTHPSLDGDGLDLWLEIV